MKDYVKKQWSGNENGWKEPVKEISTHRMHESQAEELNKAFASTGTKYEEHTPDTVTETDGSGGQTDEKPIVVKGTEAGPKKVRPSRAKTKKVAEHKA